MAATITDGVDGASILVFNKIIRKKTFILKIDLCATLTNFLTILKHKKLQTKILHLFGANFRLILSKNGQNWRGARIRGRHFGSVKKKK